MSITAAMLRTMTVNKDRMYKALAHDFSNATDMADDYLAKKGFRSAKRTLSLVKRCSTAFRRAVSSSTLQWKTSKKFTGFQADILDAITIEACVAGQ